MPFKLVLVKGQQNRTEKLNIYEWVHFVWVWEHMHFFPLNVFKNVNSKSDMKIFVHLMYILQRQIFLWKSYQTNYDTFVVKETIDSEIYIVMVI